jgi:hypothetical protein
MTPRKSFLLRVSPDLYSALETWAQSELRSVNGQIEYLLREAVRQHGRTVSAGDPPPDTTHPSDARGDAD